MLTTPPNLSPNGDHLMEAYPEQAAADYFQTIPAAQYTVATYDPRTLPRVMVGSGVIYTTQSATTNADVYTGDMRENTAKSTVSTGINMANYGCIASGMITQNQPQVFQNVVAHHARGRYTNPNTGQPTDVGHGLSGGNGILTLYSSIYNEFSYAIQLHKHYLMRSGKRPRSLDHFRFNFQFDPSPAQQTSAWCVLGRESTSFWRVKSWICVLFRSRKDYRIRLPISSPFPLPTPPPPPPPPHKKKTQTPHYTPPHRSQHPYIYSPEKAPSPIMNGSAIFLIVISVIFGLLVLTLAIVSLIKFQHPDDKNQAWFPKIIVVLGYFVVFMTVMVMPFDVANRNRDLNMHIDTLWLVALCTVIVFLCIIIPFSFFWYENEGVGEDLPPDVRPGLMDSQFGAAFAYTLMFCAFIVVLSIILYLTPANKAFIPIHYVVADVTDYGVMESMCEPGTSSPLDPTLTPVDQPTPWTAITCNANAPNSLGCSAAGVGFTWEISVSWLVYLFALLSFLGWWFFCLFSGVGLITLPMDLINTFRTRPIPLPQSKFLSLSMQLATRCEMLLKQVTDMRDGSSDQVDHDQKSRRQKRKFGNKTSQLEQEYWELQRDWDLLKICRDYSNSNPLWYLLQLVLGVICLCVSAAWILHICLFILPGRGRAVSGFLNDMLIKFENVGGGSFPFFGILFYIIFVFYLMWCVVMGNYSLGIRILFFKVYPMEVGKTQINAFLVNLWVLLLCTIPLVHFTQIAFPYYSRFTSIQVLFGLQVKYLRFFTYFWRYNIFLYIMLGVALLSLLVSLICPKDQTKMLYAKMDERAAQKNPRRIAASAEKTGKNKK